LKKLNIKKVVCGVSLGTVMVLGSMSSAFAADNNQATAAHSHTTTTTTTPAEAAHSHATTTTTAPAEAAHSHATTTTTAPAEAAHSHATTTTTTPAEAAHSHATTTTTTTTPAEAAHSHATTTTTTTTTTPPEAAHSHDGAAATLSAIDGTATLPTGTYYVRYTYVTDRGETPASSEASVDITEGQDLQVVVPALPSHASSINIYISSSASTETLQINTTSTTYDQSVPLVDGAAYPTTSALGHSWEK
jgi:hypothetical protein